MLDKKDELILHELMDNSRKTTKQIATDTQMPRVTVHDRIHKLVQNNIIKKFTIIPNYKEIGLSSQVFVFVSFIPNSDVSQSELAKRIAKLPGVYEVHIVGGEYDLILKVRGKSLEDIGKMIVDKLRQFNGVGRTFTFTCFETIKDEP